MSIQTELERLTNAKAAIRTAIEGKGVTVPSGTLLDGMAALIDAIEAGGSTLNGKKFICGTITFSETPTSSVDIAHEEFTRKSIVLVFLSSNFKAPSDNTGALVFCSSGCGIYVNSSKNFSLLSSISETIDTTSDSYQTSFTINITSANKMLSGKTYHWMRYET